MRLALHTEAGLCCMAEVAPSDRSLHGGAGAMYTLGDLASADELWSLDAGDKAA
jgi:hypothetical protein